MASYSLTVDNVIMNEYIKSGSIEISEEVSPSISTMTFTMEITNPLTSVENDDEVKITQDGVRLFAGRILSSQPRTIGDMVVKDVSCIDYTRDLDRRLVVEGYQDMTDKEIIEDIILNYCGGTEITYNNVTEGVTISNIVFNYMPPSECFTRICKLTGRQWSIDFNKDIHYGIKFAEEAPISIDI